MARSAVAWLAALWIGVLTHVDWHLGRAGHDHLSLGWHYHWLLAIVTFAPVPWILARHWPASLRRASAYVFLLGIALGQGLEPLGEVMYSKGNWEPLTNWTRWAVFAEFAVAGILAYLASAALAVRRLRGSGRGKANEDGEKANE